MTEPALGRAPKDGGTVSRPAQTALDAGSELDATESIEISLDWAFVVRIAIEVLRNPKSSPEAVVAVEKELHRMARIADEAVKAARNE